MSAHTRLSLRLVQRLLVTSLAACSSVHSGPGIIGQAAPARNVLTTGIACCTASTMRDGLEFTALAHVDSVGGELQLQSNVHVRNPGTASASFVSSESNCAPALRLISEATARSYVWYAQAWAAANALALTGKKQPTACIGGAEGPMLLPGEYKDVAWQAYPVSIIRGDSMPPGTYRVGVPVRLYARHNGIVSEETMYVWSAPVTIP